MREMKREVLLEMLAEEACELGHAALKMARILRGENPTPVTPEEGAYNLIEEYTDVIQCVRKLELLVNEEQIIVKQKRWEDRLHNGGIA